MPQAPEHHPFDIRAMLDHAVARILADEDPERFFVWLERDIERYASSEAQRLLADPQVRASISRTLARTIWNATPLPSNDFRPAPIPEPRPGERCPCGSGLEYRQCCLSMPVPKLGAEIVWARLLAQLPLEQVAGPIARGQVGMESLVAGAEQCLRAGKVGKAVALLEQVFVEPIERTDRLADYARQRLCECYEELGHHKKKEALLERLAALPERSPLRAGARAHLATIELDRDNLEQARTYFQRAMGDDPDNPSLAVLEIHLLVAAGEIERAKLRAAFWRKRLERAGTEASDELLGALDVMRRDPLTGLAELSFEAHGSGGRRLRDWLVSVAGRPVPAYRAVVLKQEGGCPPEVVLEGPKDLGKIEEKWQAACAGWAEFGEAGCLDEDPRWWEPRLEEAWSAFLERHPAAFDSLVVLDDLAEIVMEHCDSPSDWIDHVLLEPILRRAEAILDRALTGLGQVVLPWSALVNRPALRALVRLWQLADRRGDRREARRRAERVLALDPADHTGMRAVVVNERLRAGQDRAALNVAERYSPDLLPDVAYGRVLALYRLGRMQEAEAAVREAIDRLPLVPAYLVREKVRARKLDGEAVAVGSADQAWLYREEMRDVWAATPGALEWLRATLGLSR